MGLVRVSHDKWYRTQSLRDGITLIDEPWIKPFYRCNIWHIKGSQQDLLVDSGLGAVSLRQTVLDITGNRLTAVASHTHFDHIGASHEFGRCCVHAAEKEILENPDNHRTLADLFLGEEMFDALPEQFEYDQYHIQSPKNIQTVEEGYVFDLGNRQFEVLHTPGHSPGGISLWEASSGILVSGDIIYDGPLIDDVWHSNLSDYRKSLEKLLRLPVKVVYAGHFAHFGPDRLQSLCRKWLDAQDE